MTAQTPEIFPIRLSENTALYLLEKHFHRELEAETKSHFGVKRYEFSATLQANGEVDVYGWYSYDHGMMQGCGKFIDKTIKPFSEEEISGYVAKKKFDIAEAEYFRRLREEELKKIAAIQAEIFGD